MQQQSFKARRRITFSLLTLIFNYTVNCKLRVKICILFTSWGNILILKHSDPTPLKFFVILHCFLRTFSAVIRAYIKQGNIIYFPSFLPFNPPSSSLFPTEWPEYICPFQPELCIGLIFYFVKLLPLLNSLEITLFLFDGIIGFLALKKYYDQ